MLLTNRCVRDEAKADSGSTESSRRFCESRILSGAFSYSPENCAFAFFGGGARL